MANLQQENDLLINRIQLLEKESINKQEKDLLLSQLDGKYLFKLMHDNTDILY